MIHFVCIYFIISIIQFTNSCIVGKLSDNAIIPARQSPYAAGYELYRICLHTLVLYNL